MYEYGGGRSCSHATESKQDAQFPLVSGRSLELLHYPNGHANHGKVDKRVDDFWSNENAIAADASTGFQAIPEVIYRRAGKDSSEEHGNPPRYLDSCNNKYHDCEGSVYGEDAIIEQEQAQFAQGLVQREHEAYKVSHLAIVRVLINGSSSGLSYL